MKSIDIRNRKNREAISTSGLSKVYPNGTVALKDVSVAVNSGDFCVIIGLSGAGKSTLLRCMNRLIRPTAGSVALFGEDVTSVNGGQLRQVRRRRGHDLPAVQPGAPPDRARQRAGGQAALQTPTR